MTLEESVSHIMDLCERGGLLSPVPSVVGKPMSLAWKEFLNAEGTPAYMKEYRDTRVWMPGKQKSCQYEMLPTRYLLSVYCFGRVAGMETSGVERYWGRYLGRDIVRDHGVDPETMNFGTVLHLFVSGRPNERCYVFGSYSGLYDGCFPQNKGAIYEGDTLQISFTAEGGQIMCYKWVLS